VSESFYSRAPFLRARADDAVALVTDTRSYCVSEIRNAARALSRFIAEAQETDGRTDGTRCLCILLPSSDAASFMVGLLACTIAGAAAVPWRDDTLSLETISDVVRPDAFLQVGDGINSCKLVWLDGPPLEYRRRGRLIMMTSGSTGAPKGVALDFAKMALNATTAGSAMAVWRCTSWAIDIDLALTSAVSHMLMAWQFDVPFVHLKGVETPNTATILNNGFGFGGSPLQLVRLRDRLGTDVTPRVLTSSGDFLTPKMIDAVLQQFPETEIHKLYGLTEVAGRFCHMPHDLLMRNKEAAGRPLPGFSARMVRQTGEKFGGIEVKTPLMAEGYYFPGGSFEPFTSDWFATGDVGTIDEDGVITLVGRLDDVFKVGGEKIDRASIETALADILKGREYCVLAVEHRLLGQCPALFVAMTGFSPAPTWSDIVGHLRQRLPTRFIPSLMYAVEGKLPRLANGKLDRLRLARDHEHLPRLT
jgi:acyl-CoA synthetase (AMP-forming)/AMP-acid ligase II